MRDVNTSALNCANGYVRVRTWNFSDGCGNTSANIEQTITVTDNNAPVITGTIAPATFEGCAAATAPAAAASVAELELLGLDISDGCTIDALLTVSHRDSVSGTCPVVISRTYTLEDACGNTASALQSIRIQDHTKPLNTCREDQLRNNNTGVCTYKAAGNEFDPAPVTDNCGVKSVTYALTGQTTGSGITTLAEMVFNSGITLVTWTVTDQCNNTAVCSFTVTVNGLPVARDYHISTLEDVAVSGNLITNDMVLCDLPVLVKSTADPAHGSVTIDVSGSYTYTPAANYNGTDAFTYQLCDATPDCSTATVTITISGVYHNLPPAAVDDDDTANTATPVTISVLANDHDPENGKLSVTLCSGPVNGHAVVNNDGTITYTSSHGFTGDDSLCYTICDPGIPVLCDHAMVYIHVKTSSNADELVISHTLTPNGDGINDVWLIGGIEDFPDNKVEIFNRWGDQLYKQSHYNNMNVAWNGTNKKNAFLPDGTYFYILEIKGIKAFTGYIYMTDAK